jgi:hypothetical protein
MKAEIEGTQRRRPTSVFNSQIRKGAWPRKTNLRGFTLSNITCRAVAGAKAETSDIKHKRLSYAFLILNFSFFLLTFLPFCYFPRFMQFPEA